MIGEAARLSLPPSELVLLTREHALQTVALIEDVPVRTMDDRSDDVAFIALYEAWGKREKSEKYRQLGTRVTGPAAPTKHAKH